MKAMEHSYFDSGSIIGCVLSYIMMFLGMLTLGDWAVIMGIGVGLTTIIYNLIKIFKEVKRKP